MGRVWASSVHVPSSTALEVRSTPRCPGVGPKWVRLTVRGVTRSASAEREGGPRRASERGRARKRPRKDVEHLQNIFWGVSSFLLGGE